MLCAQYYGKGDMKAIQVVEGIAMRFSLGFAFLFAGAAFFFPEGMIQPENMAVKRVVPESVLHWHDDPP